MLLRDTASEAGSAIGQRPLRTVLTALGTILGVGAFVATTGLAATASAQVSSRFDSLKATDVRVQDVAPDGTNPFPRDVEQRLDALNGVESAGLYFAIPNSEAIAPRATASRNLGASTASIPVIAATPGAIQAALPTLATGRFYDDFHEDRAERVAVVGRSAADQLGIVRVDNQPAVFLGDIPYTVVGILDEVQRNPDLLHAVIIPDTAAEADFDTDGAERQVIIDTSSGAAQLVGHQAPIALRPQQPERLHAVVPPDPVTLRNQVEGDVQTLFFALSGLALLIGSVAIANATLVNIIERRPEIGLRRALGATRTHIARQITVEAAFTGAVAGIVGMVVGIIAVVIVAIVRRWTPTIQPEVLPAAPAIGVITGTVAGLIPALSASRTPSAETLRS